MAARVDASRLASSSPARRACRARSSCTRWRAPCEAMNPPTSAESTATIRTPMIPVISPLEAVPDPADRDDVPGVGGIILDLLAQPADVHVHRAAVSVVVVAPHTREDQVPGEHRALVAHQLGDQV